MKKLLLCLITCLLATTTLFAQDKTLNLSILIDKKIERTNQEKERLLREIRNVISNDYEVQVDYLLENDYDLQKAKENYLFLEDKNYFARFSKGGRVPFLKQGVPCVCAPTVAV